MTSLRATERVHSSLRGSAEGADEAIPRISCVRGDCGSTSLTILSLSKDFVVALLAMTLLLSFQIKAHAGSSSDSLFDQANAKYQARDFKGATEAYEELVKTGHGTGAVYYNLGNASFRAGRKGKAVLFYERALRVSPRDEDARWNLAVLKGTLAHRLESAARPSLTSWVRMVAGRFSPREVSLALTGILLGWTLILITAFFIPRVQPGSRVLSYALVAMSMAVAVLAALQWQDMKDPRVVILDKEVFARYGPSGKETKAFLLYEGSTARILDESGSWFYIGLANKSTGWIPKESCEVV